MNHQPSGGVVKGDSFQAMVVSSDTNNATGGLGSYELTDNAPTGHWRNGLCGCCKFGPCHPIFLLACCIPQVLLAQVMTRMKLVRSIINEEYDDEYLTMIFKFQDYLAQPGGAMDEWKKTYKRIWIIIIVYYILQFISTPPTQFDESGIPIPAGFKESLVSNLISLAFGLYSIFILAKTRAYVRERYSIPEQRCIGCEDIVCATCCGMCTVAQIATHTADYDLIRADCFSNTGLPRSVNCSQMYSA